jgi:S1-C subfamily serine protease
VGVVLKPSVEGERPSQNSVLTAKVIKTDQLRDLALLQLAAPPQGIRPIAFASEGDIQVGADVHAIGHPTGNIWTYTKGVISQYRKDFEWASQDKIPHKASVIQTQTPINPGNSGGPLLTDDGKLVGVNSFKEQGEGMNFAVSVVEVQKFINMPLAPAKPALCETKRLYDGRSEDKLSRVIGYDTNCDGKVDLVYQIPDHTGKPILALIDANFDGKPDIVVEDRDRDYRWDISFHDVDFDGVVDFVGYHSNGMITPTRFVNYDPSAKY